MEAFAETSFLYFFSQNYLDSFCEAAASPYGCLLVAGHVAVATKKWWELAPVELVLLSMLTESLSNCSSRDIPVFLPATSPEVIFWKIYN